MNNTLIISEGLKGLPTIDYRTLKELQGNFKELSEDNYLRLKTNLLGADGIPANGFIIPFFVWFEPKTNTPYIVDGHQRYRVLLAENATPYNLPYIEIKAKNKKQAKEKVLLISSQYGKVTREGFDEFTCDIDVDFIKGITTFTGFTLPPMDSFNSNNDMPAQGSNALYSGGEKLAVDSGDAVEIGDEDDYSEGSNKYTTKVAAPIYEPKNEKPDISDLCKLETAKKLQSEIDSSKDISDEERRFLKFAAERHIVFDYEKIADYYAHASKAMQLLMERSALVIIDFEQAIELGYAKLKNNIQNITQDKTPENE